MMKQRIRGLLEEVYGEAAAGGILERLDNLVERRKPELKTRPGGLSQRDSLLISYADQVREPGIPTLRTLADFLHTHCTGVISGVHVLPFYPWTSDDGFSVTDYRRVAPEYGGWEDISALASEFDLMFDAVINHVSAESAWFKGMLAGDPTYSDWFIVPPPNTDLSKVVRPRALPLLSPFQTEQGLKEVWTTFSADQVDLNYANPEVLLEIVDLLLFYVEKGADFLRMDAIAYLWKEPGTTCISLPQAHALIKLFRAVLDEAAPHVSIITETNVPHDENVSYFGDGTDEARLVYNFSLPPLVLHAFQAGSARRLTEWAQGLSLPSKKVTFFNFLASHDGVGMNPLRGLLSEAEIGEVVGAVQWNGGRVSYKTIPETGALLPYEVNINYYDALNPPDTGEPPALQVERFITAQAILLAMIGVPGIYFHSLFGSRGWPEGVKETGRNRTINRQKFERAALEEALANPGSRQALVFGRMRGLLKARAAQAAFHPFGEQRVIAANPAVFALLRTAPGGEGRVLCLHNISAEPQDVSLNLSELLPPGIALRDILTGKDVFQGTAVRLPPCGTVWIG